MQVVKSQTSRTTLDDVCLMQRKVADAICPGGRVAVEVNFEGDEPIITLSPNRVLHANWESAFPGSLRERRIALAEIADQVVIVEPRATVQFAPRL